MEHAEASALEGTEAETVVEGAGDVVDRVGAGTRAKRRNGSR